MEIFYIRASFGRLLLTKVKFTRLVKNTRRKVCYFQNTSLIFATWFQGNHFKHKFNIQIQRKKMNGLRLSQADTKKPDMKGWSDYRKADYEKTQRLLKMRWSK